MHATDIGLGKRDESALIYVIQRRTDIATHSAASSISVCARPYIQRGTENHRVETGPEAGSSRIADCRTQMQFRTSEQHADGGL